MKILSFIFGLVSIGLPSLLGASSVVDDTFSTVSLPASSQTSSAAQLSDSAQRRILTSASDIQAAEASLPKSAAVSANQMSDTASVPVSKEMIEEKLTLSKSELQIIQKQMTDAMAAGDFDAMDKLMVSQNILKEEISKLESALSDSKGSSQLASAEKRSSGGGGGSSALMPLAIAGAGVGVAALGAANGLFDSDTSKTSSSKTRPAPYQDKNGNTTAKGLSDYYEKLQALKASGSELADDGKPINQAIDEVGQMLAVAQAQVNAFEVGEVSFLCEGSGAQSCGINTEALMTAMQNVVELQKQVEDLAKRNKAEPENKTLRDTLNQKRDELKANQQVVKQYRDQFNAMASIKNAYPAEQAMAGNSAKLVNAFIEAMNKGQLSDSQKSAVAGNFDSLTKAYEVFGIKPDRPVSTSTAVAQMFEQGSNAPHIYAMGPFPEGDPRNFPSTSPTARGGDGDNASFR